MTGRCAGFALSGFLATEPYLQLTGFQSDGPNSGLLGCVVILRRRTSNQMAHSDVKSRERLPLQFQPFLVRWLSATTGSSGAPDPEQPSGVSGGSYLSHGAERSAGMDNIAVDAHKHRAPHA